MYIVEYSSKGGLPDYQARHDTLIEAKRDMRNYLDVIMQDDDENLNRVEIITPLHFISKRDLVNYGEIRYARVLNVNYLTISYIPKPKYTLTEVSNNEELDTYAFCCKIQDSETLGEIQYLMQDYDITAAIFTTDNGDYDNLHVGYGYPSFRSRDNWMKVNWNE